MRFLVKKNFEEKNEIYQYTNLVIMHYEMKYEELLSNAFDMEHIILGKKNKPDGINLRFVDDEHVVEKSTKELMLNDFMGYLYRNYDCDEEEQNREILKANKTARSIEKNQIFENFNSFSFKVDKLKSNSIGKFGSRDSLNNEPIFLNKNETVTGVNDSSKNCALKQFESAKSKKYSCEVIEKKSTGRNVSKDSKGTVVTISSIDRPNGANQNMK